MSRHGRNAVYHSFRVQVDAPSSVERRDQRRGPRLEPAQSLLEALRETNIERSEVAVCGRGQRTESSAGSSRRQDGQRPMDARLPTMARQEQTGDIVSELVLVGQEVEEDPAQLLLGCALLDVVVQLGP